MAESSSSRYGVVVVLLLIVSLALGWFAHGWFMESTDTAVVKVFDNWRLVCPMRSLADQACELNQDAVDTQSHVTVVRIAISGKTAAPTIDIATVVNVLLPAGLGLTLDDQPVKVFQYRTCEATSCIVSIAADSKLYDALLGAKKIGVSFANLNGKAVSYPLSMANFGNAVAALSDAEAKRHSWLRRMFL